ncbi:hypothetical protein [Pseudonocardia alaniniphila]|uniref:Uncharacterized protein n=1 Tax=Pseudonocardia alaniniphila TaxID=75291 RepID=A0ABS9T9V5_9PSEU|nr:hypothetical protein [Pseudonocardia alaniniphila]MCH6165315.1 hypothetical protein [Pseudonocardia alaniniphila]
MAHTRANSKARQDELDRMFTMITDCEGVVTQAEARDQRFATSDSAKAKANRERFPAFGEA